MEYFKYQQEGVCGRVWSLFSSLSNEMEYSEVKKNGKGYPMNVSYAHSLEIVNAALRGSIALDDESLEEFDLRSYERKCAENDGISQIKNTEKFLYIVDTDNLDERESATSGAGFGDVTVRQEKRLQVIDEAFDIFESSESFRDDLKLLCNIRKDYITTQGVDIIQVLLSSLKGIPDAVEELTSLINKKENSSLKELVVSLCENGTGLLIPNLEFVL